MSMTIPEDSGKQLKGRHVLLYMLGFFGVMIAVNMVFLYSAITSFPGEDVEKSYLQGLSYNDTLAEKARQAELGWSAAVGIEAGEVLFLLEDKDGAPKSTQIVSGNMRRLYSTKEDAALAFSSRGDGLYAAKLPDIGVGAWEVHVDVRNSEDSDVIFKAQKTLQLQ